MTDDRGAFIWYELLSGDPGKAKAFYDAVVRSMGTIRKARRSVSSARAGRNDDE